MTSIHQPLPAGWVVREDTHGRIYFMNVNNAVTQWQDPRHTDAHLNKFEGRPAPTVVKIALALFEMQQNFGFHQIERAALRRFLDRYEGTKAQNEVKKEELEKMVVDLLKTDPHKTAALITNRLFSLFDLKHEGSIEFRIAQLGLIFLSPLPAYAKFHEAFAVLDTNRKNTLNQENLFVMFKAITRLIENHSYRYKLAMSNRNIVGDVAKCLSTVKAEKGRLADGTITLNEFIKYVLLDPLILRPITMLEKIQISRGVVHHSKTCTLCNVSPIVGIRYKLENKDNICESCFWKGDEKKNFKKSATVTEYPTRHSKPKIYAQKITKRFLPQMTPNSRQVDITAQKQEYIDINGTSLDLQNPEVAARYKESKGQPAPTLSTAVALAVGSSSKIAAPAKVAAVKKQEVPESESDESEETTESETESDESESEESESEESESESEESESDESDSNNEEDESESESESESEESESDESDSNHEEDVSEEDSDTEASSSDSSSVTSSEASSEN